MNKKEVLEKVLRGYDVKVPSVLEKLSFSDIEEVPMKKVSLKKKYITAGIIYAAACIAVLVMLPFIIGGGNSPDNPDPAVSGSVTSSPDEPKYDLGGEEFVILSDSYTLGFEITDDASATEVSKALIERDKNTEKNFGIKLSWESVDSATDEVAVRAMSGQNDYNAVIAPGHYMNTVVFEGYLCDLKEIDTIDLSKSYWLPNAVETLTVADRMFFTSSKLTLAPIHYADFLIYNGDLMESMGYTTPYDLMDSGKWDCDTFVDMMLEAEKDLNEDGEIDSKDRHGGVEPGEILMKMCYEPLSQKNEDNTYKYVGYTERMVAIYSKYKSKLDDVGYALGGKTVSTFDYDPEIGTPEIYEMFADDRALFINYADLRDDSVLAELLQGNCGVVPFPEYSTDGSYVTTVNIRSDMLAVPSSVKDAEMTGRILDYMAGESEKTLYAEYYEMCTSDTETGKRSGEMLDLILDSVRYDWVELYVPDISNWYIRRAMLSGGNFGSVAKRFERSYQNMIDTAVAKIKDISSDFFSTDEEDVIFGTKPFIMPVIGNTSQDDMGRKSEIVYNYLYGLTSDDKIYTTPELTAVLEGDTTRLLAVTFIAFSPNGKDIIDADTLRDALAGGKDYPIPDFAKSNDYKNAVSGLEAVIYMTASDFKKLTPPSGMRIAAGLVEFPDEGGAISYITTQVSGDEEIIVYYHYNHFKDDDTGTDIPEDKWEAFELSVKQYYDDSYLEECRKVREDGTLTDMLKKYVMHHEVSIEDYKIVPELCRIQMRVDNETLIEMGDNPNISVRIVDARNK